MFLFLLCHHHKPTLKLTVHIILMMVLLYFVLLVVCRTVSLSLSISHYLAMSLSLHLTFFFTIINYEYMSAPHLIGKKIHISKTIRILQYGPFSGVYTHTVFCCCFIVVLVDNITIVWNSIPTKAQWEDSPRATLLPHG